MSTIVFDTESPYKRKVPPADKTDFLHERYLINCGLSKRHRHEVTVPDDLRKIGVALFALGRAGCIHLVNLINNPRFKLLYIVEADKTKLARVKDQWNLEGVRLLEPEQDRQVFSDTRVKAIVVAAPTYLHESLVMRGLQAGFAVFCEKPIAGELEAVGRCYDMAHEVGQPLLCAFNRRFDPAFQYIKSQIDAGDVGRVHRIKTVARDSPLPSIEYLKISGGIYHDCVVHDIDLICWILGEYPTHVFASGSSFIPEVRALGDYDTVAVIMEFESDTIGTIDISRNAVYGYDQRLEVFGPKGMTEAKNERPFSVTTSGLKGCHMPPIFHSFPSRYHQGYSEELDYFCDVIQGLKDMSITKTTTMNVTKIAMAAEESTKTGQRVKVVY